MTGDQQPSASASTLHQQLDLEFTLQAAGLGVWDYTPATGLINWDSRARALFGVADGSSMPYEQVMRHIHPDDVRPVDEAIHRVLNRPTDSQFDQTFRTIGVDDGTLRWVRFVGRSYFTESGEFARLAGIAQEVTQRIIDQQQVSSSETRFADLVTVTPVATAVFVGRDMLIQQVNSAMLAIWGKDTSVIGKNLRAAIPELDGQPFLAQLRHVFDTGEPVQQAEVMAERIENGQPETGWFNHAFTPLFDHDGRVYGVINTAIDVTEQVLARRQLADQRTKLHSIIQQTPAPTLVLRGDEYCIDQINPPMLAFMGRGNEVIGQPLLAAMPELAGQFAWQQAQRVYNEGIPFDQSDVLVPHLRYGVMQDIYYNVSYRPLVEAGQITGMIQVAIDVTEQVLARRQLEASETRLRSLIAAAPAGIALFVGRELIIENPNQTFIDIVGKGPSIDGLPLREAMPELLTGNQPFLTILDDVFTTGVPFLSAASPVSIVQNGVMTHNFYNIAYVPVRNADSEIYAILDIAIDVTAQVQAQQALKQSQDALQYAIELAELGTFSVDITTNQLTASPRVADWFGFESLTADTESFIESVGQDERDYVRSSLYNTLLPDSNGRYDVIHSVVNSQTGRLRILHALGQVIFDTTGKPVKIEGTAQDITAQRELQLLLEQQVHQRTEELAATNEELAANNEEYAAINEELEESNNLLTRSNENLQTFAYIASHDLQEPLRKIQQFGDLLKTRLTGLTSDEELSYLERMQGAAERMSTLIKDLLSFSRISTQRSIDDLVPLQTVVDNVLAVLDLSITETGAQLQFDVLPTVRGDTVQLSQLFQNLISNALKFHQPGVSPVIRIDSQTLRADQLPATIKPARRTATYYRIDVADNGIGFDEKYLDRIFQVFQRLHGKSQYVGTGIGLAICEKVVTNHGGAITATSEVGQGATFIVYLPAD